MCFQVSPLRGPPFHVSLPNTPSSPAHLSLAKTPYVRHHIEEKLLGELTEKQRCAPLTCSLSAQVEPFVRCFSVLFVATAEYAFLAASAVEFPMFVHVSLDTRALKKPPTVLPLRTAPGSLTTTALLSAAAPAEPSAPAACPYGFTPASLMFALRTTRSQ